jgi:hypothetical protein
MKRIFIGCGIVVLLLLGGIGFLAWRFWPELQDFRKKNDEAVARLNALTISAPFDPAGISSLDTSRFAAALDIRAQVCTDLKAANERLSKLNDPDDQPGMLEGMSLTLHELTSMMPRFADRLEAAHMSWPEFAWHTRLFWRVLQRISLGAGEPRLAELQDSYSRLEKVYDQEREHAELPQLKDLVGDFPPAMISEAEAVMATDVSRVRASLGMLEAERIFMMPSSDPTLFGFDKLPPATEQRIESEKAAQKDAAPTPR